MRARLVLRLWHSLVVAHLPLGGVCAVSSCLHLFARELFVSPSWGSPLGL